GAVLAALRIVRAAAPSLAAMRAQVVVDTRTFLADGEKLGLGRSAATVTAAVAAFLAGVGRHDRGEILEAALAAHALFQDGRGSGADVAAATRGGVLEFRRDGARVTTPTRARPRGGWARRRSPRAPAGETAGSRSRPRRRRPTRSPPRGARRASCRSRSRSRPRACVTRCTTSSRARCRLAETISDRKRSHLELCEAEEVELAGKATLLE